jgi:hypothetical protein
MHWNELNKKLADLSEKQVYDLLQDERANGRRAFIMTRLHQRYNILRVLREREELLKDAYTYRSPKTGR